MSEPAPGSVMARQSVRLAADTREQVPLALLRCTCQQDVRGPGDAGVLQGEARLAQLLLEQHQRHRVEPGTPTSSGMLAAYSPASRALARTWSISSGHPVPVRSTSSSCGRSSVRRTPGSPRRRPPARRSARSPPRGHWSRNPLCTKGFWGPSTVGGRCLDRYTSAAPAEPSRSTTRSPAARVLEAMQRRRRRRRERQTACRQPRAGLPLGGAAPRRRGDRGRHSRWSGPARPRRRTTARRGALRHHGAGVRPGAVGHSAGHQPCV